MPRYPRNFLETTFFHIIIQGINKIYIFEEKQDIKFYIKNMYKLEEEYNLKIIAYCIMNNHAHFLINCNKIENLEKYMHRLNTIYGKYYNRKNERVGYVFRDRYKSEGIYSDEQLYNCINYIYNNPVKARICENPWEYEFSNYRKTENVYNSENYIFIDVDEDKEKICKEEINEFLNKNKITLEELKENKSIRKVLVRRLKKDMRISFRVMEKVIEISRETLRRDFEK